MCLLGIPTSYGSVLTSLLSGKCPKDFDLHFLSLWSLNMSLILMLLYFWFQGLIYIYSLWP